MSSVDVFSLKLLVGIICERKIWFALALGLNCFGSNLMRTKKLYAELYAELYDERYDELYDGFTHIDGKVEKSLILEDL